MPKLSTEKRNQIIAVGLGTLAVAAGLWYGVINTRKQSLADTRLRLASSQKKLDEARDRVKNADLIDVRMEESLARLKLIEDGMASGADLYSWSYLLLEKARTGHEVEIVNVTRPSKGEVGMQAQFPYEAAIFTVTGIGHYHDFGKFLADFENKFPYFRVQNLSLGTTAEAGADVAAARIGKDKLVFKMDIVALIKPRS